MGHPVTPAATSDVFGGPGALDELAPPGSVEEDWALRMIEALLLSGAGRVALFSRFEA
jgi:hypothetical protein